ncbi:MAG TPA: GTPase [Streptosporangiaceae bacterium]|nr:GTPase [Streptosporangiaceae bacterium]
MKEGQGVAPASVPWGADDAARVSARPPAHARRGPAHATGPADAADPHVPAHAAGPADAAEPHVRVDARKLESALLEVREAVGRTQLLLDFPGIEAARAERQQLISQVDDYLLPRLRQSGAPILIAMVGSTGAGKSTLLNSIVGSQVSATGVRRPTTNSPVLACHPEDAGWFAENVFLPTLPRVRQQGLARPGRDGLLVLATSEGMPRGIALLDTPDIDSVVAAHRQFARQFLDASDLWLFVTTARRYADAVVWELLKDARDRGASLGVVLSRVPPAAGKQLSEHFEAMLEANGLGEVQRFVIPETIVTDAQLPAEVSAPVRSWLEETSRRDERRIAILTQTMSGVLDSFEVRVPALAGHAETQLALGAELRSAADAAYSAALAEHDEAIRSGSLLRGEVLARWQDFAGTGDLMRTLEVRKGKRPSQRSKRHAAMPARAQALKAALRLSVEALTTSLADRAAEDAMERWQASPAGTGLLAEARQAQQVHSGAELSYASLRKWEGELRWGFPGAQSDLAASLPAGGVDALSRSSADLPRRVAQAVAAWQDHLLHLVQTENVTRRSIARIASFDPESLALVLTIGVLGYGAGDVIVSEGASAVPQRLLTSLFGAGLMRDIGGQARQDLHERIGLLFSEEALRFTALMDAVGAPDEAAPTELYQASYSLESAR